MRKTNSGRAGSWHWLSVALLLLLSHRAPAQNVLRKDLKRDFGAVGDGRTNDQTAFGRAADFFNNRAKSGATAAAVLIIPKGVYLVGQQAASGETPNVLELRNCRNLSIEGADSATTEIRYVPGLRYGAFDPQTHRPYEAATAFFTDTKYAAKGGVCLVMRNCENVTVSNLAVNGNSQQLQVGGHWGDTGIQLDFDGVFVQDSRRITLRRLALHHLGRDGIQVLNRLAKSLDEANQEAIVLENLTCRYNGRQGLSITGVNGLRATNCSFSHTGRVMIPALGKPLFSNPGAGVDLEPEGGYVANVRFDNCRFVDNAGQGIVADRPSADQPATTKNVVFANSLVWGLTNWSAWVTQPGFLFKNCRVYGAFVHGCRAATPAEATRFVSCTFEDRPYRGQAAYGMYTLHSDGAARGMSFTDCRFVGTHNGLMWAIIGASDTASFFHLRSTTFLYDYTQSTPGINNNMQDIIWQGANVIKDGPHRTSSHRTTTLLGNGGPSVPTIIRAPGSLRLLATNCFYDVINGLDIGRRPLHPRDSASLIIGPGNAVRIGQTHWHTPELYIGPTSRLVVKKGGSLEIISSTHLTLEGQLIIEDGAYFYMEPAAVVQLVGKGRLRVGAGAVKGKNPVLN